MSARSRTAAGPRERGWSRLVPEVFCERPFPNKPVHSRTRTHSFSLSHGLCSVFPIISDLFRARMLERFQVCDRLSIVSPLFWLYFFHPQADPGKPRTVATRRPCHLSQDTQFLWLVSHSASTRKTHTDSVACLFSITSQPQRGRGAAAPRGCTALLLLSRHRHPHAPVATVRV